MFYQGEDVRVVDLMNRYGVADGITVGGFDCRYSSEEVKHNLPDTFRFFPTASRVQAPEFLP